MIAPAGTIRYRYERKFHVAELSRAEVESIVRLSPALFSEIYHPRWVNSVYLDTWTMASYHENLAGCSLDRVKFRIRWYGDILGPVERPTLELKIKHGQVNRKELYPLPSFVADDTFSAKTLGGLFRGADLPDTLRQDLLKFRMVLAIRYRRNYLLSADRDFRATIDSHLEYFDTSEGRRPFRSTWLDPTSVLLELKYAVDAAPRADRISQHFPFRLTRNSKYATGVQNVFCR
jgi:hypothetical protein